MKKLNLAIIGQGRSGKDIHGKYYISDKNEYFNVKYVVEADERRRRISKTRYEGCEVLSDYKELFDKSDIDLVVNASFSNMHFEITKNLLENGFNVLCEKPFVRDRYECDVLTNLAKEKGVTLAVFQQTFYAPFYRDALRVIKEKEIGDVLQVSIRYNTFARRWDWQTLQKKMAGNAFNTGPHPFGMALGFLDFDDEWRVAFSRLRHTPMSSGDSDDYCKVILTAPGKPVVDVEINNTDAFSGYNLKIQGSRGTFRCSTTNYEVKYIVDGENPERPVIEGILQDENGNPKYCGENLAAHLLSGKYDGTAFDVGTAEFYKDLYFKLSEGRETYVTLDMARKIVSLIERLYADSPMPVKY